MLPVILFVYGIAIGSFLNVLIDRLSMEESIGGRSHCDYCKHTLHWTDLIPVLSYVFLGGKCRYCHKKLSIQYPAIELLTGIIFVLSWYFSPLHSTPQRILSVALASVFIVIFFADVKYQIIPDEMQIAVVVLAVLFWFFSHAPLSALLIHLRDGFIIMAPILFLYLITKGKGMGFGDVKLAFGMGFLLGAFSAFLALYIAFLSGAAVGLLLLVARKKKMKAKIAFGPFLVLGTVTLFFASDWIYLLVDKVLYSR